MAQQSNEHLTIAELSAYLDEELAPEELALCDAHIQTCQPCQAALTDLRLTSALLGSMPQVAVPRSFALPTNLVLLPETPDIASIKTATRSASRAPAIWRSSIRVASTLVAILGLLFFLAGALSALPHGGGMAASSTNSSGTTASRASAPSTQNQPTAPTPTGFVTNTPAQHISPDIQATHQATSTGANHVTPTPISTQPAYSGQHQNQDQDQPQPELPAALDLGQPTGRLAIGAALLLLGILGVIITRLLDRLARQAR